MHIVLIESDCFLVKSLQKLLRKKFPGAFISTYEQAMDFILDFAEGKLKNMNLLLFDDQMVFWFPSEENFEKWGKLDTLIPGIINRWNSHRAQDTLVPFLQKRGCTAKIIVRTSFPEDRSLEGAVTIDKEFDDISLLETLSSV